MTNDELWKLLISSKCTVVITHKTYNHLYVKSDQVRKWIRQYPLLIKTEKKDEIELINGTRIWFVVRRKDDTIDEKYVLGQDNVHVIDA